MIKALKNFIEKIKSYYNSLNKRARMFFILMIVCAFACLVTFFCATLTRVRVTELGEYTERDKIALYIYKYDKLPSNFITKTFSEETLDLSTKEAIASGYNFGGDNFLYKGSIVKYTMYTDLKECDYYPSREVAIAEGRGTYRLVYNVYGNTKVYYTEDHYQTFNYLSKFEINIVSNLFWIQNISLLFGEAVLVFFFIKKKNESITRVYFNGFNI